MTTKDLGADAAAVEGASSIDTPERQETARILAAFDAQFGTDGPEKNSDSDGRKAGCDDCATSVEIRAEHRAFVARVVEEIHMRGQLQTWQAFADFLAFDPRKAIQKAETR